jgi:hypothetical protein
MSENECPLVQLMISDSNSRLSTDDGWCFTTCARGVMGGGGDEGDEVIERRCIMS